MAAFRPRDGISHVPRGIHTVARSAERGSYTREGEHAIERRKLRGTRAGSEIQPAGSGSVGRGSHQVLIDRTAALIIDAREQEGVERLVRQPDRGRIEVRVLR